MEKSVPMPVTFWALEMVEPASPCSTQSGPARAGATAPSVASAQRDKLTCFIALSLQAPGRRIARDGDRRGPLQPTDERSMCKRNRGFLWFWKGCERAQEEEGQRRRSPARGDAIAADAGGLVG